MIVEPLEARRLLALTPIGPATDVPQDAPAGTFDVAVAGNGNFIVARVNGGFDSINHDLQVIRYDAAGQQVGSVITVATGINITSASVSMDAEGDAVISYSKDGVFVARLSKHGVLSTPVKVNDGYDASVSMDDSGGYFLAWGQSTANSEDVHAMVQAFDKNGVSRAAAITLFFVNRPAGTVGTFVVDAKPDGSGAVVAGSETFEGADDNVAYADVSTTAILSSGDIQSGTNESDPAVAINADGSFEIAYTRYDKVGGTGGDPVTLSILVQRFDSTGATAGSPIALWPASNDANVPQDIFHTAAGAVSLDSLSGGGFAASWVRAIAGNLSSNFSPLFVERFNSQGVADSDGPFIVTHNAFAHQIGADASGNVIVVYQPAVDGAPLQFLQLSPTRPFATLQNGVLYVAGTGGDDTITLAASGSNIIVTRGGDQLSFAASSVNVVQLDGFDGNDTITNNTAITSTLRGGEGADTIFGGPGIDRIHGGVGNDSLWGGGGPDKIFGEDGVDSLYGNGGNDRLEGGAQHDHIRGNAGHDTLLGNGGNDQLYGGSEADRIYGGPGVDELWGEGGNDRLYGDDGAADTLHGGAGDDVLITLDGVVDQLFGDGGHDSANADQNDVLTSIEAMLT